MSTRGFYMDSSREGAIRARRVFRAFVYHMLSGYEPQRVGQDPGLCALKAVRDNPAFDETAIGWGMLLPNYQRFWLMLRRGLRRGRQFHLKFPSSSPTRISSWFWAMSRPPCPELPVNTLVQ